MFGGSRKTGAAIIGALGLVAISCEPKDLQPIVGGPGQTPSFAGAALAPVSYVGNCGTGYPGNGECPYDIADIAVGNDGSVYACGFRSGTVQAPLRALRYGRVTRVFGASMFTLCGAVAVSSTHVFAASGRRLLRFGLSDEQDVLDVTLPFVTDIDSMLVSKGELILVDQAQNQLVFVGTDNPEQKLRAVAASNPTKVAKDAAGNLWVAQAVAAKTEASQVVFLGSDGMPDSGKTINVAPRTIRDLAFDAKGLLRIATDENRLLLFNVQSTPPAAGGFWGTPMEAEPYGLVGDDRIDEARAVALGADGAFYLAQNHSGNGSSLSSYDVNNRLVWRAWGLGRDWDAVSIDPGDETTAYGKGVRYKLDYTRPAGQEATPVAFTYKPGVSLNYGRYRSLVTMGVRRLNGKSFLAYAPIEGNFALLTRLDPALGGLAVPFFMMGLNSVELPKLGPTPKAAAQWTWLDADNNGNVDEAEVKTVGPALPSHGLSFDNKGGLWTVSADKKHILHLPVVGFDAAGYPTYKAAEPRVLTLSGTIRSAQRTAFDTTTGTLAVAGSVDMIVDDGSIDAGDTIEFYAAAGTEIAPKLSFVAKAAVENAGLIRSIAAEDGYLFVGFAKGSVVAVWRLDATSANAAPLVILEPSPGIRTNDRLEVSAGVRPTRRANGEFVVTVADGYYGKTLMYRFNPRAPNGGKATRGPTGVTLTFSKPFEGTASRYHVFRALEGPQTYQRVGETTTTTFIDTNAPQQGPLRYRVSATFASGAEAFSNEFLLR